MNLMSVDCYHCGASRYRVYDRENGFRLVKCRDCGLLYVNPRPPDEDITEAAMSGMHVGVHTLDSTGSYDENKINTYARLLPELYHDEKLLGRWLDIGCGYGEFMMALKRFSPQLETLGSEPNHAKRQAAKQVGLNVSFLNLDAHPERYEYLSLLNVFSHLPNPVVTLNQWKSLLKSNGEMIIQTGDTCDLPAFLHHKPYALPNHLSFASETIVCNILVRLGFEIVAVARNRSIATLTPTFALKQLIKIVWPGKRPNWHWFPRNPYRDIWIRAKLIS